MITFLCVSLLDILPDYIIGLVGCKKRLCFTSKGGGGHAIKRILSRDDYFLEVISTFVWALTVLTNCGGLFLEKMEIKFLIASMKLPFNSENFSSTILFGKLVPALQLVACYSESWLPKAAPVILRTVPKADCTSDKTDQWQKGRSQSGNSDAAFGTIFIVSVFRKASRSFIFIIVLKKAG
jgi:hypothetical protein